MSMKKKIQFSVIFFFLTSPLPLSKGEGGIPFLN